MRPLRSRPTAFRIDTAIGLARRLRRSVIDARPIASGLDDEATSARLAPIGAVSERSSPIAARWWIALASLASAFGADVRAARLLERAVRSTPSDADAWSRLGRSLSHAGPPSPTPVTGLGMSLRHGPAARSVELALERSVALESSAAALCALSEQAIRSGRLDLGVARAVEATSRHPRSDLSWVTYARARADRAQHAGGLTADDVDEIGAAWRTALHLRGPVRERARFHLLRHSIRFRSWEVAFDAADSTAGPVPTDAAEVRRRLVDPRWSAGGDWWYVAWWWLQSVGDSSTGLRARRREAEARLDPVASPLGSVASITTSVRCLLILDRTDEAVELLTRARRVPVRSPFLDRLLADLELRLGAPDRLVHWTERHPTGLPRPPEARFESLVRDRRVAVVGPNASPEMRSAAQREADLVIDTKRFGSDGVPSGGAHVSYYADTSAAVLAPSIVEQLDTEALDLAVLRPTAAGSAVSRHPAVRIMPTEDTMCLGVSHFGIARIVYDVLRYSPRSVLLAGVDLFTAPEEYPDRYVSDRVHYDRAGFVPVLPRFNHDVIDDFRMLGSLRAAGLLDADVSTASVLDLSLEDYLRRLDEADRRRSGAIR